jgi:hypothetical protein
MLSMIYKSILIIFLYLISLPVCYLHPQTQDSSRTIQEIHDSKVQLTFGLFLPSINSTAQLNAETGRVGTIINLETAFSLPETQNLFRMNGIFRFDNRHSVEPIIMHLTDRDRM